MQPIDRTDKRSFQARMRPYYEEAAAILRNRQRKYGPANILAAGIWGVLEQTTNKVERARAQLSGEIEAGKITISEMDTVTESVFRDSLFDLANYALIALALYDGEWTADMRMEDEDE